MPSLISLSYYVGWSLIVGSWSPTAATPFGGTIPNCGLITVAVRVVEPLPISSVPASSTEPCPRFTAGHLCPSLFTAAHCRPQLLMPSLISLSYYVGWSLIVGSWSPTAATPFGGTIPNCGLITVAVRVASFNVLMESKGRKKKSSSSSSLHCEAPLGYIIEDVRPHGGIKKFQSSAYSNCARKPS
ncbi:hypothetical protein ZIOFF_040907 [Zingiber officinale]|uniref:Uncharacterized protein n=1 Tax=Zingiber officinale TaxID=94328 RepID=A0A8J5L4Y5_ZINOF|nr:hypothetical protein ZIOFF_040907 [Zingiber officinale]